MSRSLAQPRLVVVAGAPATGKTTLAKRLAAEMPATALLKDDIKESMADVLGTGDRPWSRLVGRATYAVLYLVARRALEGGSAVVLEANFYRAHDTELRALAQLAGTCVILCRADASTRRDRFTNRAGRHGIHLDAEILEHEWIDDDEQFAIEIGVPRLVVDTTAGYAPEFADIARFARG